MPCAQRVENAVKSGGEGPCQGFGWRARVEGSVVTWCGGRRTESGDNVEDSGLLVDEVHAVVDELTRVGADDVHADNLGGVLAEYQLEHCRAQGPGQRYSSLPPCRAQGTRTAAF
eukprot:1466810-Prymnesium_polylepis.1